MKNVVYFGALVAAVAGAGCFAQPEPCSECRSGEIDSGAGAGGAKGQGGATGFGGSPGTAGATGSGGGGGGGKVGTGGTTGAGGTIGTGGRIGTGGTPGTGGMTGVGGKIGTGGMIGVGGAITIDPDLVAWYKFDETTGTAATDSSGHNQTAALVSLATGSAAFSTTHQVGTGALKLTSTAPTAGGYVVVPASLQAMGATTAITIACWVNVTNGNIWQRVFDFGSSSTTTYMFLTTQEGTLTPNSPRFAITQGGRFMEQVIDVTTRAALSTGAWHHLAIVLGAGATYTGTLYIDKVAVGSNAAMTLRPSDLGNSINNWIGRSQFSAADSLFDGMIDDFRIYKRALTAAEIAALP